MRSPSELQSAWPRWWTSRSWAFAKAAHCKRTSHNTQHATRNTQHARRLGKQLSYRVRLRSFESVCRMVGQSIGVGIVPQAVAARCARSSKVKRIALTDAGAARNLIICVRQLDKLPAHAQLLAEHVLAAGLRHE